MRRFFPLIVFCLLAASCGFPDVAVAPTSSIPAESAEGADSGSGGSGSDEVQTTTPPMADASETPVWSEIALVLEPIAEIENPIAITGRSGTLNLYVATRDGKIIVIERTISPTQSIERTSVASRPMLDLTGLVSLGGERGLLNIAFSSDGRNLFVYYTDPNGDVVVDRYQVDRSDRTSVEERIELVRVPQFAENHNGGGLAVGPDGFLYIGLGDGGGAGDPIDTGQDPTDLLGSLLRIDPISNEATTYAVPANNPFADGADGAAEVWMYGLRNPWRFSFDQLTGDLWLADVGQDRFEEINRMTRSSDLGLGANLGWSLAEGSEPFDGRTPPADHTPPIFVYPHEDGRCSVTGGVTSRTELMPQFDGIYVFGDYCTGEIFGLTITDGTVLVRPLLVKAAPGELVSFGQDTEGRIFVVEIGGRISRIAPEPADAESDG